MGIYGKKVWFWRPTTGVLYKSDKKQRWSHGSGGISIIREHKVLLDNGSDHEFDPYPKKGSFKIWKNGNCIMSIRGDNKLLVIPKKHLKFTKYYNSSYNFAQGGNDTKVWTYLVEYKEKDIIEKKQIKKKHNSKRGGNYNPKFK